MVGHQIVHMGICDNDDSSLALFVYQLQVKFNLQAHID